MRSVPPWIGASDDTPVPPRVRIRIFERWNGHCARCGCKIISKGFVCDHIVAIINGGKNKESNLQPLCSWCNKIKTHADVQTKAQTARIKAKHLGVKAKSRPMPGSKASKFKRKMDGRVVRRD